MSAVIRNEMKRTLNKVKADEIGDRNAKVGK